MYISKSSNQNELDIEKHRNSLIMSTNAKQTFYKV